MTTVNELAPHLVETRRLVYNRAGGPRYTLSTTAGGELSVPLDERWHFIQVPLFAGMEDAELERLVGDLKRRSFAADQTIFYQGDPGNVAYIIESGQVRIYLHGEEGQEVSVIIYGPGDIFGEMSLLDRQPRSATAIAMEDTVLLAISADDFYRHLRQSHQLALNLMLALSTRLRETTESVESLATLDVNRRLIKKLLQLAQRQGVPDKDGIRIRGRLPQQSLASLIGASRESANRALRALTRQGMVQVRNGRIVIRKLYELERLIAGEDK